MLNAMWRRDDKSIFEKTSMSKRIMQVWSLWWNLLFFWVECILNQSFLSGEMRDCSHPIWWSGCGSCRCNKHEGHNKKRVRKIKRRPLHPLLKQGWTFCNVAFHVLRHFYIPLQANHELHLLLVHSPFRTSYPLQKKKKTLHQSALHLTLSWP